MATCGRALILPPRLCKALARTAFCFLASACRTEPAPLPTSGDEQPQAAGAAELPGARVNPIRRESLDVLGELPFCEVRHRGLSIDVGSKWADAHRSFQPGPFTDVIVGNRAGHGTGEVLASRIEYDFWLDRPTKGIRLGFQALGERASVLTLFLDGRRIGDARLSREDSKVHDFGPLEDELTPGRHVIALRSNRGGEKAAPAYSLDWIRVHLADNYEEQFAAPTAANIIGDVELGGQARRSLSLRGGSSVRCAFVPGATARVKVDVGFWGEGEGSVEVRVHLDHQKSVSLAERRVQGGDQARWTPLDLALDAVSGGLAVLEFSALESTGGGRLVFGEPTLVRTSEAEPPAEAKTVVIVVASGVARDLVPPWADKKGMQQWFAFSERATLFEGYRVASTLVGSVVASLLTGLPGSEHMLLHTSASLAPKTELISRAMREAGGRSAFFTNVPYTFEAFGLGRDFNRFEEVSPVADLPADEPLLRGRRWLESEFAEGTERKRLLVVHVRGGHPPFDLTPDEAKLLSPAEYNGILEPRRAAILLRDVRDRDQKTSRKLGPKDWERLIALQRAALAKQDAAIGALFETLRTHGQWKDSMVVLMGDVARGDPPQIPFEPYGELREDRLSPPLLVKFPGPENSERQNTQPVGTIELSHAIFRALGLEAPGKSAASDPMVLGGAPLADGGIVAVHPPTFVYSVGRFRVGGTFGETPLLCDLEVDPACQHDLYAESPFQMEWLWRLAFRSFQLQGGTAPGNVNPARIDEDTRSALTVYGL
jgi:hypothetical protein